MTPSRNRRIRELFDAAVGKTPEQQAELLWRECGDDDDLVRAVWKLLGANRKSDGFLSSPMWKRRSASSLGEPGSAVGPYKIVRQLGAGGMGIVYQTVRADQIFRRVLALKIIRPDFVSDRLVASFEQERRILGDLEHLNIARIVDGGATENLPYFVMDYVDGVPIDKFCQQWQLTVIQKLNLFLQVCAATCYLHHNSIVHGDLKPSNILVTADAIAKILDFGIARVIDKTGIPNQDGAVLPVMTPNYASPEQLRGDPPGYASDIFSLGVVLYELLTGSKPHAREHSAPDEVITSITTRDPLPPSSAVHLAQPGGEGGTASLRKSLRGDLDCIVMKALRRDVAERYPTVSAFATDIDRYLQGRTVGARKGGLLYRTSRFAARNRVALATAAMFAFLIGLTGWQAVELQRDQYIREALERQIQDQQKNAISHLTEFTGEFGDTQMRDLRELEESYRVRFPEALHILPGPTPSRLGLVDDAQNYLNEAEPLVANDRTARRELAFAWLLVGDVQGNAHAPSLRDEPAAARSYRESARILQELLQESPRDEMSRQLLDRVNARAAQQRNG